PGLAAASLEELGASALELPVLARAVAAGVLARLERLEAGERSQLLADFSAACSTLGRAVRVEREGGETLLGTAEGLGEDGALLVRADVRLLAVTAGEVSVRPA
ncbi:MAG TPA: hypothetical protein VHN99_04250, partial [Deinococcales bacterium]|nr:hypothetical protein [Deinococcales bacterium]